MSFKLAIPTNSLILVTGANGHIGSHVADQLLAENYRVRAPVRSLEKSAFLQKRFDSKYGAGKFELVVVEDVSKENAYDEVIKGVSGVIHCANPLIGSVEYDEVVTPAVDAVRNILQSALKTPSVKRVVITSSIIASTWFYPTEGRHIDKNTWNDYSVKLASELPKDDPTKAFHLYGASKTLGEKEAWKFVQENKPQFVLNTVLPSCNFGPVFDINIGGSTSSWVKDLFLGNLDNIKGVPPHSYVDVRDDAWIHVQALLNENIQDERLHAAFESFNWDGVLDVLRKQYPHHKFVDNFQSLQDTTVWDNKRTSQLFEQAGRKPIPQAQSIIDTIEGYKLL
eukprot:TRINITY_DN2088_c0_g2_i3.p1 TRINITY_DN2088_c0_g2~~TRINITY_DN2088_c0_g2_i3.p1  ORF type:complete len:339 (+),score=86.14 TRINITY_DN2088_c0_g2_i3:122-1138(+)